MPCRQRARRTQGWAEGRGGHRAALAAPIHRGFLETIRQRPSLDFQPRAGTLNAQTHCTVFSLACVRRRRMVRAMADQARQSSIGEFQCARCGAVYDVATGRPVQSTMPPALSAVRS
jgi:hypothetical protein